MPSLTDFMAGRHRTDLLRVQTLDRYDVTSDEDDFKRWQAGDQFTPSEPRRAWAEKLAGDAAAGKVRRNVHVVREPLSEYLRFMFDWGYGYNAAAGQDIRIVSAPGDTPAWAHIFHLGDFTLVEHKDVVSNRYSDGGAFLGAVQASADAAQAHAALAEIVWEMGVPFAEWWTQHPEYHRAARAA